jgi:TonB family protein
VVYTELARSSGNAEVDQFAQQMFARMQFLPAMVNGAPVDVWVQQPVQVR